MQATRRRHSILTVQRTTSTFTGKAGKHIFTYKGSQAISDRPSGSDNFL